MAEKVASLYGVLDLEDNMTPALKKAAGESEKFGDKIKKVGKNVSDFGAGLVKISAPFVAGIGVAIKAAIDFDEQITNVASVMGLSAQESDAMGQAMLALSRNSKFSGTELTKAMYDVAGGVADASKHMDILAAASALAEANNSALDGSTNALIATMNTYRDANVSASQASDVLTMTVKNGVGTMDELAAVFGTTATLAAPLGIDIEELGFLFAELSKNGATFGESGTRIEAALSSLINPTKELQDAFSEMGMTQADVVRMLDEQGLTAVIKEMTDAGIDLTTVFNNKEALLGVLAIAGVDSAGLEKFATDSVGATEAMREIASTTDKFQLDTLLGDFSDMAVVVGQALVPAFSGIVTELSPIVQGFADWAKENPQLIQDIAKLALGITGLGLVLMPIGWLVGAAGTVFGILSTLVGGLTVVFGGLAVAVNAALFPISAIVLGVMAGIGVFIVFRDEITRVAGIVSSFVSEIGVAIGIVINDVRQSLETFIQLFEPVILGVGVALSNLANSPLFTAIRVAFEVAFNAIKGIVEGVVNAISGFLGGIKSEIERILSGLGLLRTDLSSAQQQFAQLGEVGGAMLAGQVSNWAQSVGISQPNPNRPTVTQPISPIIRPQIRLPGKAEGGDVWAGMPITVGERGKEWFVPSSNGTIVNQRQAKGMGGLSIGTLVLNGINDPQQLFDKLRQIEGQRGI